MSSRPDDPGGTAADWVRRHRTLATIAAVLAGLFLIGLIAGDQDDTPERPGDPAVYQRIETTTDCDELQDGFDRNDRMHEVQIARGNLETADAVSSYMRAYHERLRELGCYD